jgi:hypothetical protein
MSAIDRVKNHWSDRIQEIREIEVPEWGDDNGPLVVYVRPTNMAQRSKLFRLAKEDDLAVAAETVVLRARDKDGLALFKPADAEVLMTSCDPDVLTRLAAAINSDLQDLGNEAGAEAAEKK